MLACTLEFLEYIVPAAILLLCLHHFFNIPSHVFRKLLHLAAFTCLVEMMWAAEAWYQASLTAVLFAAVVYPILRALENRTWFSGLYTGHRSSRMAGWMRIWLTEAMRAVKVMIKVLVPTAAFSSMPRKAVNTTSIISLVTGGLLTVLGGALILLHYWEAIKAVPVLPAAGPHEARPEADGQAEEQ